MATIDYAQLALSRRLGIARVLAPDLDLSPGSGWYEIEVSGAGGNALALYSLLPVQQQSTSAGASGAQLDAVAADAGITSRVPATFSTGYIPLQGALNAPAGGWIVQQGRQFWTQADVNGNVQFFVVNTTTYIQSGQTVNVNLTAKLAGKAGNIAAGALLYGDQIPGVILITNPIAFGGGVDQEGDVSLRGRISASKSIAGTPTAIANAALAVPGCAVAIVNDPKNGTVNSAILYIGQLDGTTTPALIAAVQSAMPAALPITFNIAVQGFTLVYNAMQITVSLAPGVDSPTAQAGVISTVQTYVQTLTSGQTISRYALSQAVLSAVSGLSEFFLSSAVPTVPNFQLFRFLAPPLAPSVGQSSNAGSTIAANTFYVALVYDTALGPTLVGGYTAITLATSNNLQIDVTVPTLPQSVTGARIYVGTSPTALALQSSGNAAGVVHLSVYNSAGAAPPVVNTVSQPTITVV